MIGNTVALKVKFANESGMLYDVTDVKLVIYNDRKKVIHEVDGDQIEKVDTGTYKYEYTIPNGSGQIYYEYQAMYQGSLIVGRRILTREWILRGGGCDGLCND
ncbi:hypothetical protein U1P98_07520 [Lysinibacillus irui]|uniref:Uncharacterized protein n=1 Tax=Lysinibacillus irui TaxID=2998077 RepID=A0ABU5NJG3_9BACI|nr:hypothetical protein [Lysinibacillus irui]MEA0553764.1 hypothetical protein [Lysinibacillus irui]MEA0976148.1 hypothetical protein [Lysinibacillus irui]MEA1042302.1 hypothetical protein [Lysinibacillus irui]